MMQFLTGEFIVWLPIIFSWAVFLAAGVLYALRNSEKHKIQSRLFNFKTLIIGTVIFKFLYAILVSAGQYYVWTSNEFTRYFLNSPLSEKVPNNFITDLFPSLFASNSGYFLYYAYGRFFLNPLVLIIVAFAFWLFLRSLKKYQDRFFDTGEVELGFLTSLVVGWPNLLIFVPLVFISVVIVSIIRGIFLKQPYTTLGWPMILACAVCMIWGNWLVAAINLTVFKI